MRKPATILLPIDDALRFVLYGISVTLEIDLAASQIEQMFTASTRSAAREQMFEFHRSPRAIVSGRIEDYEPETVWLTVQARRFDEASLKRLVDAARHASFGMPWLRTSMDDPTGRATCED